MALTTDQRNEYSMLRIKVYANLDLFLGNGAMSPFLLAELLGYKRDFNRMRDNFTARDIELCQALSGPHGYTIYRMLLARLEPCDEL